MAKGKGMEMESQKGIPKPSMYKGELRMYAVVNINTEQWSAWAGEQGQPIV